MDSDTFDGSEGLVSYQAWDIEAPRYVVLLVHGYGEHIGRYSHVADAFNAAGASVYGNDHLGHGRSEGERVLISNYDHVVDDVHALAERARADNPGLPLVMVGHSMGGTVATRFAQRFSDELAGLVLSGAVVGDFSTARDLLALPEIPDQPIDPAVLSRDVEVQRAYSDDPLVDHGPFKRPTLEAWLRALDDAHTGQRVRTPILHVHGEDDQLIPLSEHRETIEALAAGELTQRFYPGARHEVFNETNRDEVLADTLAFAEGVAGG